MADAKSPSEAAESKQAPDKQAGPTPDVDQVLRVWQRLATQAVESLRGATQPLSDVATVDVQHAASSGAIL